MQTHLRYAMLILIPATVTHSLYSQGVHKSTDTIYGAVTKQLRSNKIPDSVFLMTQLKEIWIQGDDCDVHIIDPTGKDVTQCWMIDEIPPQIKNLKNLSTLRITLNAISKLPKEMGDLQNLKLIDFTDGAVSNVDAVTQITGLEYLYLYGCNINKMPENIGCLKNLKELGLRGNYIEKSEQDRIRKALPHCRILF